MKKKKFSNKRMTKENFGCGKPDCVPCTIIALAIKKFPNGTLVTSGEAECDFVDDILFSLAYFIGRMVPNQELRDHLIKEVVKEIPLKFDHIQKKLLEEEKEGSSVH